jgi:hypothetical protein
MTHGGRDRSAGDAYSPMLPDSTLAFVALRSTLYIKWPIRYQTVINSEAQEGITSHRNKLAKHIFGVWFTSNTLLTLPFDNSENYFVGLSFLSCNSIDLSFYSICYLGTSYSMPFYLKALKLNCMLLCLFNYFNLLYRLSAFIIARLLYRSSDHLLLPDYYTGALIIYYCPTIIQELWLFIIARLLYRSSDHLLLPDYYTGALIIYYCPTIIQELWSFRKTVKTACCVKIVKYV